jgi:TPP-dependent pyruvate/acetoin dehydrogenase alpha subunit
MRYRTSAEREQTVREDDPLKIFKARAATDGLFTADQLDAVDRQVAELIDSCARSAMAAPFPTAADLETCVYAAY